MTKIVVLDGYTTNPGDLSWAALEALGDLKVYDRTRPEDVAACIGTADIVFTNKTPITRETMAACPSIRFIGVLATGYNIVDVTAATERNIPVCNVPTYGTTAVAQFVFAHLLEVCHHISHHADRVRDGEWVRREDFSFWDFPLIELWGKTMGIIGYGKIGRETAKIARAFGMKILFYDSMPQKDPEATAVSLNDLLSGSDVVSLHCPLFPETQGMIDADALARMKPGTILINTSRGPLVVEEDVRNALESGHLGWYCADVVSVEPIRPDNPLLLAPRCVVTPHIAWAPSASRARLMNVTVENLRSFLDGKTVNAVNL